MISGCNETESKPASLKIIPHVLGAMYMLRWIFIAAFCYIRVCEGLNPILEYNTQNYNGIYSHTHIFKESSEHLSSNSNIRKRGRMRHDQTHVLFLDRKSVV